MARQKDNDIDSDEDLEIGPDDDLDEDFDDEFDATSRRFSALRKDGKRVLLGVAARGRKRLEYAADRGKNRMADRLEEGADYLRNDIAIIRDDLVDGVQRSPLLSAGIALGVGFVLGKALTMPGFGRNKKSGMGGTLASALVSSAMALIASRLKDTLLVDEYLEEEEEDEDDDYRAPPRGRPSRNRPSRGESVLDSQ